MAKEELRKREYNIDLLRCISMFLIVLGHYFGNVNSNAGFAFDSLSYVFYLLISCIEGIGVNVFVIISSYFLVDSKFSIQKILNIWMQVFLYSSILYFLSVAIGITDFSVKEMIYALTPIFSRKYWFATEYIRLYLVFPFLNILIRNMSRKLHKYLCVLLLVMNAVFPTLMNMESRLRYLGNWSLWFITLYIVVAYVKVYDLTFSRKKLVNCWFVCTLMMFLSKLVISNVTVKLLGTETGTDLFSHNNSPFMLGSALAAFMLFAGVKINSSKLMKCISFVAPLTFGIYLFHENPSIKQSLYQFIHDCWVAIGVNDYGSLWFAAGIISVIILFVGGAFIDKCRIVLSRKLNIGRLYAPFIDRLQLRINSFLW